MKRLIVMLAILMAATPNVSAVSIVDNVTFDLSDAAHIVFLSPQQASHINVSKTLGYLEFNLNSSWIVFRTNTNKTLSGLSYDNSTDVYSFTGTGTSGYLNVTAKMNSTSTTYGLYVDGSSAATATSNSTGWVLLNYSWTGTLHNFQIKQYAAPVTTGGGGGGGNFGEPKEVPAINPPEIKVNVKSIGSSEAELELLITNEGKAAQEYVYTWTLQSVNKTTNATTLIDNRQASKQIEAGKTFSVPLKFESLSPGNYSLEVEVDYGKLVSKALTNFEIKQGEGKIPLLRVPWYLLMLPVVLLIGLYLMLNANKRRKKPQRTYILKV